MLKIDEKHIFDHVLQTEILDIRYQETPTRTDVYSPPSPRHPLPGHHPPPAVSALAHATNCPVAMSGVKHRQMPTPAQRRPSPDQLTKRRNEMA